MTTNYDQNGETLQIQVTPEVQVVAHARLAENAAGEQNLITVVTDTLGYVQPPEVTAHVTSTDAVTVTTQNIPTTPEVSSVSNDPARQYENIVDMQKRRAEAQALAADNDLDEMAIQQQVDAAYRDAA